jgi:hypothetical protein
MASGHQGAPEETRRQSLFERSIDAAATSLGESIGWLATHGVLLAVFVVLWVGVGLALILSPATIDSLWVAIGASGLVVQVVLWVLFLPVMAGLWVWESSGWADLIRIALIVAIAAWNLLVFKPKGLGWPRRTSTGSQT